ncbi:MAG: Cobalamin biosynthesis protein CbiD [Candidatus Methanohalarchaeum thermophilum]|uniref:Cobalamin biosynthesis protein CbiD n=1 Tax=Methanohalarchaeum thermophilum TaxID=1903181 RepID=A0A1Q6DVH3_METT1|nr:MAG: Cobalamin biosynthesis protein CbiD [Candidatus Methanohalarchaeum thermophilum]
MNDITDPVTGVEYPQRWIKKSNLSLNQLKEKIEKGKHVLVHDGSLLERGYTTGTIAAASVKAALMSRNKKDIEKVTVQTPVGIKQNITVKTTDGEAFCRKPESDHSFDSTEGVEIKSELRKELKKALKYGKGIGEVNNKSFSEIRGKSVGQKAHDQIRNVIYEVVSSGRSEKCIEITVPDPPETALKVNSSLGVKDGISILGSTGFVEPWNEKLIDSKMNLAQNSDKIVFTTGMMGMRYSKEYFLDYDVIKIGRSFDKLLNKDFGSKKVVLAGLPGLILKWGDPDILDGLKYQSVAELVDKEPENKAIDNALKEVKERLTDIKVVLFNNKGKVIRKTFSWSLK